MNNKTSTLPFEIYELHLFSLVAKYGSFTRAAAKAHITQSAITRQIQGMEKNLGTALFERNTRSVKLTAAGNILFAQSSILLKQVEETLAAMETAKNGQTPLLRVGVCRSIGLSYLPGFLTGFRRKHPNVQLRIETDSSPGIVTKLLEGEIDTGVIHSLQTLPRQLTVSHKIRDDFSFIYPSQNEEASKSNTTVKEILTAMPLLMPQANSQARDLIDRWLVEQKLPFTAAMELDNFDLIVNLVALGLGCSIIPNRALPLYLQRGTIRRLPLKPLLSRTLLVVANKTKNNQLAHDFIEEVLF